jgi:acylphosphatase
MPCRRFLVSGRVQGVWFRASTRERAQELGLKGRAVNLADGRVEVIACGEPAALDALAAWLWHGPEMASVEDVVSEQVTEQRLSGFHAG